MHPLKNVITTAMYHIPFSLLHKSKYVYIFPSQLRELQIANVNIDTFCYSVQNPEIPFIYLAGINSAPTVCQVLFPAL